MEQVVGSRGRWLGLALAVLALALPGGAFAQATVHVEVQVHVEATPSPSPPIVVVEQPSPIVVLEQPVVVEQPVVEQPVVVEQPIVAEPASPAGSPSPITPVLTARGQLLVSDEHAVAALGGAVGIGASLHREWSGAVVAGYLGDPGHGGSELDLGIEITKDFDPGSVLGFYVLFGIGAAFLLDDPEAPGDPSGGPRMMAQLGVGARMSVDEDVALTVDGRGVLRYALPDVHDLDGEGTVTGGAMLTLGLAIRL